LKKSNTSSISKKNSYQKRAYFEKKGNTSSFSRKNLIKNGLILKKSNTSSISKKNLIKNGLILKKKVILPPFQKKILSKTGLF
jgi:hypothetical protein